VQKVVYNLGGEGRVRGCKGQPGQQRSRMLRENGETFTIHDHSWEYCNEGYQLPFNFKNFYLVDQFLSVHS
jgi:hypothetical protein